MLKVYTAKILNYDVMKIGFRWGVRNRYRRPIYVYAYLNKDKWVYEPYTFGPIYPNQSKKIYLYQKRYTPTAKEVGDGGELIEQVKLMIEYRKDSPDGETLETYEIPYEVHIFDVWNLKWNVNEAITIKGQPVFEVYDYYLGKTLKLTGGSQNQDSLRIYGRLVLCYPEDARTEVRKELRFESVGAVAGDDWLWVVWSEKVSVRVGDYKVLIYPAWPDESVVYTADLGSWWTEDRVRNYLLGLRFSPPDGCWILGNFIEFW